MSTLSDPLTAITIGFAALAALILLWFLILRPTLGRFTKLALLAGLGVLPIAAASTGNVAGYQASKQRSFCGSCHVMRPWTEEVSNPDSTSLAARHSRNDMFGDESCYTCHEDYGQLGAVTTKLGGLRHVYLYVFGGYREMSREQAVDEIHIRKPYPNGNCMHCHSTRDSLWLGQPDHARLLDEVRADEVSCASAGCHGPAHPFSHGGTP